MNLKKYSNWDLVDLLKEQMEITAEIYARVNVFKVTHAGKKIANNLEDYKVITEVALDILENGTKAD